MSGEEENPTPTNPYARQKEWGNDVSLERNKGLFKRILQEGIPHQKPADGSKVEVHYVGRLLDGTVFDSSRDRDTTFEFVLGSKAVIKGWDEGVKTMARNEKCILTCKPEYAYGEKGSPPKIPANATLQFEIELLGWKGEDITEAKDGGVRRLLLRQDVKQDYYIPKEGAEVQVRVVGRYEGNVFEEKEVTFVLGEGSEHGVVEGVEMAIKQMRKGQRYRLDILSRYAYGDKGCLDYSIPPKADLQYEVELIRFEKMKEPWDYENVQERIAEAAQIKERGSTFFKEGRFEVALKVYKRAFNALDGTHVHKEEDKQACQPTLRLTRLNMALCHIRLSNGLEAREECDKVLETEPGNVKALFRRGQAFVVMQEFEPAVKAFEECLAQDPQNKAARTQLQQARERLRSFKSVEKKRYVKMFAKLSAELNKDRDYEAEKREEEERKKQEEMEAAGGGETSSDEGEGPGDKSTEDTTAAQNEDKTGEDRQGASQEPEEMEQA